MMRVGMRGFVIVLALVFAFASAGTVLCEMNCAAGESAATTEGMPDGSTNVATSHCDGEQIDVARQDIPTHHGSSDGNTKHSGAHSHLRFVATVGGEVQIFPAIIHSEFAMSPLNFGSGILARGEEDFWNNNSSPPINSSFVFAASVLRI
jgi:hypothetical protein